MTDDLNARVDEIAASLRSQARPPSDLYIAMAQSRGALRRFPAARVPINPSDEGASQAMVERVGDASQAVLSLYLAATAVQRWCLANDNPGPLGRKRLAELVATLTDLRDALMHWEDKRERDPDTFLAFGDVDVLALLPEKRQGPTVISGITWTVFEKYATRLERWSSGHLGIESAT